MIADAPVRALPDPSVVIAEGERRPPTILIVEDESIVALDLKNQLTRLGYAVTGMASTGEQAVDLALRDLPALILMDVRLRGPMDGIETAARIRAAFDVPVIFLTAHSDDETVHRAAATAAHGYLTKPYQLRELRAGIEVALKRASLERELRDARMALEEERARQRASEVASRSKREFLARASHEMRTPLNAVLGFAHLLQHQLKADPAKSLGWARHIHTAGEHLLRLVNDVLDIGACSRGTLDLHMRPLTAISALLEAAQLLESMALEHGVRLVLPGPAELMLTADPTRLLQVLLNVGSNAIKYSRPGGAVHFFAEQLEPGWIRLRVIDDGIGMSPEQLQRLYQPFDRLGREYGKVTGAGLGLVITRELVGLMNGRLIVDSQSDVGTTITVELPEAQR